MTVYVLWRIKKKLVVAIEAILIIGLPWVETICIYIISLLCYLSTTPIN